MDIEWNIARDDWETAGTLIEAALVEQPASHWLLTRLALVYYEQRNYVRALEFSEQAFALDPDCPLVLWDYVSTLETMDRPHEAIAQYSRVTARGIDSLAYDRCGEGRARARGLYADCLYRMSHCYLDLGDVFTATQLLKQHLERRGPGCQSIYPIADVRRELRALDS